tara:strand:+ start:179 stop:469 length:291 start_codon:yes stop_codon:yes gene_type:complete
VIDINKTPMVRVTWVDARDMETGWLEVKEILNAPVAICQEVGWLVINNEEKVVIMRSFSEEKDATGKLDQNGGGAIAIPKGWIKKIEYLKVEYATQ